MKWIAGVALTLAILAGVGWTGWNLENWRYCTPYGHSVYSMLMETVAQQDRMFSRGDPVFDDRPKGSHNVTMTDFSSRTVGEKRMFGHSDDVIYLPLYSP